MSYHEIATSSKADVLRYFFTGKLNNPSDKLYQLYTSLLGITEAHGFCDSVRSRWHATDDNSVVGWTVGTRRFDASNRVERWIIANVDVNTVYSKGIDDSVNCMLDMVKGNLSELAHVIKPFPAWGKMHRFDLDRCPDSEFHMIGVAHQDSECNGTVELLDGSHRLTALAAFGKPTVKAYLAVLK